MSTYLQLCNALIKKVGITGTMSTVVSQTGEMGRVTAWVDDAYLNIQLTETRWNWMRATLSFTTVASQSAYTAATAAGLTDFANWKMDSFRRYVTSTGVRSEQFLDPITYDNWRDTYLFGSMRSTTGDPTDIAEGPDMSLNLGLIPDSTGYTVVGEYYKSPTSLTADSDTPTLPARYHQMIVYRAMMMYGAYESAPEVYQEGAALYEPMLRRLLRDQIDDVTMGSALA